MKKFLILPAFALAAALVGCEPAEPAAPVVDPPTTTVVEPVDGDVDAVAVPVEGDAVVAPAEGDVDAVVVPEEGAPAVVETP